MPSLDDLRAIPGNSVAIKYLIDELASGTIVPLVGPGVAEEAGYVPYRQFITELAARATAKFDLDQSSGAIAQLLIDALGERRFTDLLEDSSLVSESRQSKLASTSVSYLPALSPRLLLTTNMDRLIERSFLEAGTAFRTVSGPYSFSPKLVEDRLLTLVWKLYGDPEQRDSLILTDAHFQEAFLKSASVYGSLNWIAAFHSFLFLGYWYPGPAAILDALARTKGRIHYAIAPLKTSGAEVDLLQANEFYASLSIRPIWCPDDAPIWRTLLLGHILSKSGRAPAAPSPAVASGPELAEPIPSPELIQSCLAGECVAVVGSGLSARSGVATWASLVEGMVNRLVETGTLNKLDAAAQYSALKENQANAVADYLSGVVPGPVLIESLRAMSAPSKSPSPAHMLLRATPFAAVITTNYDDLLEKSYAGTDLAAHVFTPRDVEQLLELHGLRKHFLLKLYGSFEDQDSLIYAPADYQSRMARNPVFLQFLEGLLYSRTLLFVGMSLDGIIDFLSAMPPRGTVSRRHYALVSVAGESWRVRADVLLRRYGVEVIPYPMSAGHPQVDDFLQRLHDETVPNLTTTPPLPTTSRFSRLRKVELINIGPFEHLEIEIESNWTVLLGDNGVGKSSILKAIAVAISGTDARPYAGRLVRAGQTSASIKIHTDRNPSGYLTEIYKKDIDSEVTSIPSRCLEAEEWIALGFPPLRTVSWRSTEGPTASGKARPSAEDVLPLLRGDADPRMDKLKQWIVNLDSQDKNDRFQSQSDTTRAARTLKKFFEVVTTLTDGLPVELAEVSKSYDVLVKTPDGVFPIEALSQGMTSLFSWVGILLQRLFEMNDGSEDPSQSHALVLMDEIDAHMHPAWQQVLVTRLKKIFSNAQFLISTHSPLIVAGLTPPEVLRFTRDKNGRVISVPVESEMTMGRADQILTGDLFGLRTTFPQDTTDLMRKYEKLLGVSDPTSEQQLELRKLESALQERVPPSPEDPLLRFAQELVEEVLLNDSSKQAKKKAGLLAAALERKLSEKKV